MVDSPSIQNSLELTMSAYRDLSAAVPGPYWAIVKEDGNAE
jgi:hypothetical protein